MSSTTTPKAPTAYQLEQAASLWMQLANQMREDDELRPDEAEIEQRIREMGYTSPSTLLSSLIDISVVMGQKAEHMDGLRKRYTEKRDRYLARQEKTRATITQLMEVMNTQAHEGELGSASFAKPRKHVVVPDVEALPEQFIRRTDPEPKKLEIAAEFRAGRTVAGAEFTTGNDQPSLRITKY